MLGKGGRRGQVGHVYERARCAMMLKDAESGECSVMPRHVLLIESDVRTGRIGRVIE